MTTQYAIADILPKDALGQPLFALTDISTSQLDFALQSGVAASVINAKRHAYQGVATHKQSDGVATTSPGVAIFGNTAPLAVGNGLQYLWLTQNGAVNTQPSESYTIVASGSTAASADTLHSVFGSYNGLSDIGASVVLDVELSVTTNGARVFPSNTAVGFGTFLSASQTTYKEMKPMQRTAASALHFLNHVAGSDSTINWFIYRKD